jgi:hypothetical protein
MLSPKQATKPVTRAVQRLATPQMKTPAPAVSSMPAVYVTVTIQAALAVTVSQTVAS